MKEESEKAGLKLSIQKPVDGDFSYEIERCLLLGRKATVHLDSILRSRGITLPTKGASSQSYGFSSSHVWMWELTIKKAECQRIYAFELWYWRRFLRVPWSARRSSQPIPKEIKSINSKGHQPWMFIGWTYAEAEAPILWPPKSKSWLTGKAPDAGNDWGEEEERVTEDETVGWHYWPSEHEFEQTSRDSEGQGSLECCSTWGHKELDTT